jgi:hypothetical protein
MTPYGYISQVMKSYVTEDEFNHRPTGLRLRITAAHSCLKSRKSTTKFSTHNWDHFERDYSVVYLKFENRNKSILIVNIMYSVRYQNYNVLIVTNERKRAHNYVYWILLFVVHFFFWRPYWTHHNLPTFVPCGGVGTTWCFT